jgi:hypothetical protein
MKFDRLLKMMRLKKAVGQDDIPIEVWKCLGEIGITRITSLFNNIYIKLIRYVECEGRIL